MMALVAMMSQKRTYIVSWNYFSFDSSDFCRLSGFRFGREIIGTGQGTTTGGIVGPICGVTIKILRKPSDNQNRSTPSCEAPQNRRR
jgi:hypothetical protein